MTSEAHPLIKVARVRSVAEATMFEELGADIIGVSLAPEHGGGLFADDRALSRDTAAAIGHALGRARLAIGLANPVSHDAAEVLDLARRCMADLIQVPAFDLPDSHVCQALAAEGIGLIVGRFAASHDDDPAWILSPLAELGGLLGDPGVALAELELLPDHEDAWQFLTTESPRFSDELQIDDIEALAQTRPLLLSSDITPDRVGDMLRRLPSIRGISLTLGTLAAGRHDVHAVDAGRAAAVARAARAMFRP